MGSLVSRKTEASVLCVGLDNSGKSTIINALKSKKAKRLEINPTVGYTAETIKSGKLTLNMLDMSGAAKFRELWQCYYDTCDAVIFVVDSADPVRLCVVKDELSQLLDGVTAPILFCANKMDLPTALDDSQLHDALELGALKQNYRLVRTNGLTGEGLAPGLEWLNQQIEDGKAKKSKTASKK